MLNNKALKIVVLSTSLLLVLVCLSFARTDHRGFKGTTLDSCQDCHSGSGVADNHGAFFVKEHRLLAQLGGSNCKDCHQQSFCLDCHTGGGIEPDLTRSLSRRGEYMPRSHRADFISTHSMKASANSQNCTRCHTAKFCSDCHTQTRKKGSMSIKSHRKAGDTQLYNWNSDHAAEARRNLQSCESCHPEADVCVQCHSSGKQSPHPRNWRNISSKFKTESRGRTCTKCHIKGSIY